MMRKGKRVGDDREENRGLIRSYTFVVLMVPSSSSRTGTTLRSDIDIFFFLSPSSIDSL